MIQVGDALSADEQEPTWGEISIAFVASRDVGPTEEEVAVMCKQVPGGYKKPREVHFLLEGEFARRDAGKNDGRVLRQRQDLIGDQRNGVSIHGSSEAIAGCRSRF